MSDPSAAIDTVTETVANVPKYMAKDTLKFTKQALDPRVTIKAVKNKDKSYLKDAILGTGIGGGKSTLDAYAEVKGEQKSAAQAEAIAKAGAQAAAFEAEQSAAGIKARQETLNRRIAFRRGSPGRPIFTSLEGTQSLLEG